MSLLLENIATAFVSPSHYETALVSTTDNSASLRTLNQIWNTNLLVLRRVSCFSNGQSFSCSQAASQRHLAVLTASSSLLGVGTNVIFHAACHEYLTAVKKRNFVAGGKESKLPHQLL
jgi:hypothetical protein